MLDLFTFPGPLSMMKLIFSFRVILVKLEEMRCRLASYGYHPDEIEYAITEVLQYKNSKLINRTDLRILCNMLEERIQIIRARKWRNFEGRDTGSPDNSW